MNRSRLATTLLLFLISACHPRDSEVSCNNPNDLKQNIGNRVVVEGRVKAGKFGPQISVGGRSVYLLSGATMSAANGSGEKERWLKRSINDKLQIHVVGVLGETKYVPSKPGMGSPIPAYYWIDIDEAAMKSLRNAD